MYQDNIKRSLFILGFGIVLFTIVFFSLNYEEIKTNSFKPVPCYVTSSQMKVRNCCSYYCPAANHLTCISSTTTMSCANSISRAESLDPTQCPQKPDQCFKQDSDCSGGYYCCHTQCDKCKTCDQHGNCKYYPCNCRCALFTYNLACHVKCSNCYSVEIKLKFEFDEKMYQVSKTIDFKKNIERAESELKSFTDTVTEHTCWINEKNPYEFEFHVRYTTWKWVILFFVCMIIIVAIWNITFNHCYHVVGWPYYQKELAASRANSVIIGAVVPFVILLPIYFTPDLDQYSKKSLLTSISILFGLGHTWSYVLFLNKGARLTCTVTFFLYIPFFLTFLVFVPLMINSNSDSQKVCAIIMSVIDCGSLMSYIVYKYATRPLPAIEIPTAELDVSSMFTSEYVGLHSARASAPLLASIREESDHEEDIEAKEHRYKNILNNS